METEFEHRNLWLQLVLGLLSLGSRLDALLEQHAPEGGRTSGSDPEEGERILIDLALGAIALRRRFVEALDEAAATTPRPSAEHSPEALPGQLSLGDLLR